MAIQIRIEPCLNWFKFKLFSLFKWRKVQTKPIGIYAHQLTDGMLLHMGENSTRDVGVCNTCYQQLCKNCTPSLALANGMWLGNIPHVLSVLSLPERILVARYFPAAYIVKLFPKKKGASTWARDKANSAVRGNVSTYRLNTADIEDVIGGSTMPPPAIVLSATIGVTFVGPKNVPEKTMPDFLKVRRRNVLEALTVVPATLVNYIKVVAGIQQCTRASKLLGL
jgi:hypothetical protein